MTVSPDAPQHMESGQSLLDESYRILDYREGALFDATSLPSGNTSGNEWLEKGEWLALAKDIRADKLFFIDNEPVIVFYTLGDDAAPQQQMDAFRRAWCMARPQRLFLACPMNCASTA